MKKNLIFAVIAGIVLAIVAGFFFEPPFIICKAVFFGVVCSVLFYVGEYLSAVASIAPATMYKCKHCGALFCNSDPRDKCVRCGSLNTYVIGK